MCSRGQLWVVRQIRSPDPFRVSMEQRAIRGDQRPDRLIEGGYQDIWCCWHFALETQRETGLPNLAYRGSVSTGWKAGLGEWQGARIGVGDVMGVLLGFRVIIFWRLRRRGNCQWCIILWRIRSKALSAWEAVKVIVLASDSWLFLFYWSCFLRFQCPNHKQRFFEVGPWQKQQMSLLGTDEPNKKKNP